MQTTNGGYGHGENVITIIIGVFMVTKSKSNRVHKPESMFSPLCRSVARIYVYV